MIEYVLVVSETDPVARAVASEWGVPPAIGPTVDGTPVRCLRENVGLLRRPGLHIQEEHLVVPAASGAPIAPTLVFPSVHRSASDTPALTVHPLGNPTGGAEVGGLPHRLVPTDPRRMTDALRRVAEVGDQVGWKCSFEATHHGPFLEQPAFFVEIGFPDWSNPPAELVRAFAKLLPELVPDPRDRVAVGLGGGHYTPHFTDLALGRSWAFGHLLPRHVRGSLTAGTLAEAYRLTPEGSGTLYHRAEDVEEWRALGPTVRLRDSDAPGR